MEKSNEKQKLRTLSLNSDETRKICFELELQENIEKINRMTDDIGFLIDEVEALKIRNEELLNRISGGF